MKSWQGMVGRKGGPRKVDRLGPQWRRSDQVEGGRKSSKGCAAIGGELLSMQQRCWEAGVRRSGEEAARQPNTARRMRREPVMQVQGGKRRARRKDVQGPFNEDPAAEGVQEAPLARRRRR